MATEKKKTETKARTKKRTTPEYVVELEEGGGMARTLFYAVGAVAGLALGAVLARGLDGTVGRGAAERIRSAGRRMTPGRLRRSAGEVELLVELEDRVLDAFLGDRVLSEEGIDVGVVAPGVVELSGVVSDRETARRALHAAQQLDGVWSVLNRMEIEDEDGSALHPEEEGTRGSGAEWTGLRSGMGTRRQGRSTDPFRNDDSHHQRERAVEKADRDQWEEEGYHHRPRMAARGNDPQNPGAYGEDDLDNQSPYGKHATPRPPRDERNSQVRVGEGLKPATELRLEGSDVPVKPHQRQPGDEDRGV